ncbi:MAG TPA: alpha/beta fold hydrolase [Desulfarculaceae bacterium]|nr:alpha/beta fold hydrolase [Desulfarculaceae bacterium]
MSGQGEPLVFIHGLGSSSRDWECQVEFFAGSFKTLVFDLRGHGRSDKPAGPYSMQLLAQDTAALIKALKLEPVYLVGISLGGMVALQLALDSPELVKSLVLVNAVAEVPVKTLKERFELKLRLTVAALLGMRYLGKLLAKRLFPKSSQQSIRELFVERWAENDPASYRAALQAVIGWSVTDKLDKLDIPLLVVAAEYDYIPLSAKASIVDLVKNAELLVIKDSRHGTPVDQPEVFNRTLSDFLVRCRE